MGSKTIVKNIRE